MSATTFTNRQSKRELFFVLIERDLRLRSKRAWMGSLWPVAAPFFLMGLYVFVFSRVFDAPVPRYPDFVLAGLLPWAFLSISIGTGISSISSEPNLVTARAFPYELLPLSSTATLAINFGLTLLVYIGYLATQGRLHLGALPLLAIPVVAVILLAMGISMVVALIDVYNRDLNKVLGNLLMVWFFLAPIVYTPSMAPGPIRTVQSLEPMSLIATTTREILYGGTVPPWSLLARTLVVPVCIFFLCLAIFRRFSRNVAKDV
jgi:ABC-type polysaccharide/polyol phosphate export permease